MRRRVLVRRPIATDLPSADAVFTADPGAWLPEPARPRGPGCWTVELAAGPATRSVACRVGGVWRTRQGTWRSVRWQPEAEAQDLGPVPAGLPRFRGEIGLVDGDGGPELVLRGSYRPPGGWLGTLLDTAGLRGVAATTGRRFLQDVGEKLGGGARVGRPNG